jgi:hypothetical protein
MHVMAYKSLKKNTFSASRLGMVIVGRFFL